MSLQELKQHRPLHIFIAGSASGIGAVAAKRLVREGHVVYHACRSPQRAQEAVSLAGGGVPVVCDLSRLESVQECAAVMNKVERIDVLCLNAAVAPDSKATKPKLTANGFEECIGVNHLGHFLLANLLYPKLKANPEGARLVVTASSVHDPESGGGKSSGTTATVGNLSGLGVDLKSQPNGPTMVDGMIKYHGGKVYKDSKLCNLLFAAEAAKRYASSNVDVVSLNPGFVPTTGLFDSLRERSPWQATALVWAADFMGWTVPLEIAGERLVYMILNRNIPSGSYYSAPVGSHGCTPETGFQAISVSREASDVELASQLWEKSCMVLKQWLQ